MLSNIYCLHPSLAARQARAPSAGWLIGAGLLGVLDAVALVLVAGMAAQLVRTVFRG